MERRKVVRRAVARMKNDRGSLPFLPDLLAALSRVDVRWHAGSRVAAGAARARSERASGLERGDGGRDLCGREPVR